MSQKKISQAIGFHGLGKECLKNYQGNHSDLVSFTGEKFLQDVGNLIAYRAFINLINSDWSTNRSYLLLCKCC